MATFSDLVVTRWGARFMGRRFACAVGKGGIGIKRGEGDGVTPTGTHRIEAVFARPDRRRFPGALPIRPDSHWCDAPGDPRYNCHFRGPPGGVSAERMFMADPRYDLVAVLDYNRAPVVAGKGSAIFLHGWRRPRYPTAGCIAFDLRDLGWILRNWQPGARVIVTG